VLIGGRGDVELELEARRRGGEAQVRVGDSMHGELTCVVRVRGNGPAILRASGEVFQTPDLVR